LNPATTQRTQRNTKFFEKSWRSLRLCERKKDMNVFTRGFFRVKTPSHPAPPDWVYNDCRDPVESQQKPHPAEPDDVYDKIFRRSGS
jgi:hypothetical protein